MEGKYDHWSFETTKLEPEDSPFGFIGPFGTDPTYQKTIWYSQEDAERRLFELAFLFSFLPDHIVMQIAKQLPMLWSSLLEAHKCMVEQRVFALLMHQRKTLYRCKH